MHNGEMQKDLRLNRAPAVCVPCRRGDLKWPGPASLALRDNSPSRPYPRSNIPANPTLQRLQRRITVRPIKMARP